MTIPEINDLIAGTEWHFDRHHVFDGVHGRYIENHNVLIGKDKNLSIVAVNKNRSKWNLVRQINGDNITVIKKNRLLGDLLYPNQLEELFKGNG